MLRAAPNSWAGEELEFILDPSCGSCTQGSWDKTVLGQSETSVTAVLRRGKRGKVMNGSDVFLILCLTLSLLPVTPFPAPPPTSPSPLLPSFSFPVS